MKKIRSYAYIFSQGSLNRLTFTDELVGDSYKPGCASQSLSMASDAVNRWSIGDVGGGYPLTHHAA